MAIRLDTRARLPAVCGLVGTGDMTCNFIPFASNCWIAGSNEIPLVPGIGRTMPKDLGSTIASDPRDAYVPSIKAQPPSHCPLKPDFSIAGKGAMDKIVPPEIRR
jgi:hypothetical protein